MPHQRTTDVFFFDELDERAKERARDWFRSCLESDDYADSVIEDAARMADLLGINLRTRRVQLMGGGSRMDPCIYWSGFSHQGQGACFVGTYRYARGSVRKVATEAPATWVDKPTGEKHESKQNTELNCIARELASLQRKHFYKLFADVSHHGHGEHEYSVTISVDCDCKRCQTNGLPHEDAESITELLRDFMRWIYVGLKQEYDYQTSDDVVDEAIRANEYEFDEDGRRI